MFSNVLHCTDNLTEKLNGNTAFEKLQPGEIRHCPVRNESVSRVYPLWYERPSGYKPRLYVNLASDDWHILKDIRDKVRSSGRASLSYYTTKAMTFTDAEWDYLYRANAQLAKYGLLVNWCAEIAQNLTGTERVERANALRTLGMLEWLAEISRFAGMPVLNCNRYENDRFPRELERMLQVRYAMALFVSINGALLRTFIEHSNDEPLLRCIHAMLFSMPYRSDWADCPFEEMYADHFEAARQTALLYDEMPDFRTKYVDEYGTIGPHAEFYPFLNDASGRSTRIPPVLGVITCYWTLLSKVKDMREREKNSAADDAPPAHVRKFRVPEAGPGTYAAGKDVSPLPEAICGRCFNKLSNAIVPMLCAEDEYGMGMVLVPATTRVWNMILRLYGIPEHDRLFPESGSVANIMVPECTEFPLLMMDTKDYIYAGTVNVTDFFPEDYSGETDNPDHVFHAFYVR